MSTEIALRSQASMVDKVEYCRLLADSGLLPDAYRGKPANVLYAIEYGDTLGITPMAAITGVHVIKGKPSASAALISGLVRRAGHKLRVRGDALSATAQIIRSDDPDFVFESTFTIEDARRADLLGKDVWKQYPAAMLKNRAITAVCRDACEEVLFGLHYSPEELDAEVNEAGEPVYTAADAADAVVRKAEREVVELAPRGHTNPLDPDFELPASIGPASSRPATDAQLARLAILVGEKRGISGGSKEVKARRLALLGGLVGREIATGRDLTLREASDLIERLSLEPDHIADAVVVGEPDLQSVPYPAVPDGVDPDQVEADLQSAIEAAATPQELQAAYGRAEQAVKAGAIGKAALGPLGVAAKRREDELSADSAFAGGSSGQGWTAGVSRQMDGAAA